MAATQIANRQIPEVLKLQSLGINKDPVALLDAQSDISGSRVLINIDNFEGTWPIFRVEFLDYLNGPKISGGVNNQEIFFSPNEISIGALHCTNRFFVKSFSPNEVPMKIYSFGETAQNGDLLQIDIQDDSPQQIIGPKCTLNTRGFTVSTLPTGDIGMRAYVTDATAPIFRATVVGGGSDFTPVIHNGTTWICG